MTANATMTSPSTSPVGRRSGHTALALALTAAVAMPSVASAAPPRPAVAASVATADPADNPKAVLDVDVALGESDDEILGKRLETEATTALDANDVDIVHGAADSKISVEVRWDADENHAITVRVTNRGEPTKAVEGSPFICDACGENELITKIREVVPECIPLLATKAAATPEPSGDPPGTHDDQPGTEDGPGDYRKIGAAGIAGIVVLAGGVGLTVFGGIELARGEETDDGGGSEQIETIDHRPRGVAFVAAGASALVAGAVLLAVDLTVLKNRRKRTAAKVAPLVSPRFVGLGLSGRF